MATDDSLVRAILLVIAVVLILPIFAMVLVMPFMGMWGWGHMGNGPGTMWNGTGPTWLWFLTWLAPLLLLIGIGYLLYRAIGHSSAQRTDPALEELRLAYARGDLSDEEYEQRRERLERDS